MRDNTQPLYDKIMQGAAYARYRAMLTPGKEVRPMVARCKFVVESVTHHAYGGRTVVLGTHYDEKLSKEDRAFSKATPNGKMTVDINNPMVFDVFKPGTKVYMDITPAED